MKACIVGAWGPLGRYLRYRVQRALVREAPAIAGCRTPSALAPLA